MADLMMVAGGKAIPVTLAPEGKKLALRFRNFRPLREAVKCMKGSEFKDNPPRWVVTDCTRNRIWIDRLQNKVPAILARYDAPLVRARSARTGTKCPCQGRNPQCMGCKGTGKFTMPDHQLTIKSFELTRKCCIVAAEQGTGKTLPTQEVMEENPGEWWYVGPVKVLDSVKIDFKKWGARVEPRWVSYNRLHKVLEQHRGAAPVGVVFDEASFLKGKGPWYQAAQHLADAIREEHNGFVILLTGTPAPRVPTDWHSLAEVAMPGFLREANVSSLTRRLAVIEMIQGPERAFPKIIEWKRDEVEKLGRRLEGLVLPILAKDVQDLPPLREELIQLPVTEETKRAARMIANAAATAAAALDKVRQLSDGFQYHKDEDTKRGPTPKDGALSAFLECNRECGRVLVYAPYTESIDRCVELCLTEGWNVLRCDGRGWAMFGPRAAGADREQWMTNLDRSLDPGTVEPLAFVGHPQSGGYGFNFTAAREGVCYSCDFNWGTHSQMLKRGHREGMSLAHGFTMYYLLHLPTDAYVLRNHKTKKTLQSYTIDEIIRVLA